ncbi:MAG: hypothetical protein FJ138_01235 [Deltaproteobacteria bacterium]|nr:hypothetical protein [Deltaproteobacteria bacterium]
MSIAFVPLLAIPFALYHVLMLGGDMNSFMFGDFFNKGHIITITAVVCLAVEIYKSTNTKTAIGDMLGSIALFVVALIEFVLWKREPTFFLLVLIMAVDVVGGMIISQRGARRDVSIGGGL